MNFEGLIAQSQAAIADKIGVKGNRLEQSEEAMIQRGYEGVLMNVQSLARIKLKESIKSDKEVTMQQVKDVIRYQIKCLKDRSSDIAAYFDKLPKTIETLQITPLILTIILNDYAWQEYKLEEEDFMKLLTQ